jgi:uncharacterized protein YndB with AHSA1/START domain
MAAEKIMLTVEAVINAPVNKVWDCWTNPQHITQWNYASDDWHCPSASNNTVAGGIFSATMAAKDGSFSFEFGGVHDDVKENEWIASTMGDGRKMKVVFSANANKTIVTENFEAEGMNPVEMQQAGWQAILNNFKKYTESV